MKANQWIPKVICLVGAIILWIFVMNEQNPFAERTITVPIQIQNLNSDNKVILNPIGDIQLRIRGPRLSLAEVSEDEVKASVDLKLLSRGTYKLPLHINLPHGIELVESQNYFTEVVIDDLVLTKIPLETQIQGKLSDEFQIRGIRLTPEMITVKIPFSEKEHASKAYVPIKLDGVTASFFVEATPILGGQLKLPPNWTLSLDTVKVAVEVAPKDNKVVPISFQSKGKLSEELEIQSTSIEPEQIRISGSRTALSKVTFVEIEPIDLSQLSQGENKEVVVNLQTPADISTEVQQVKVILKIVKR